MNPRNSPITSRNPGIWRIVGWGGGAVLLVLPAVTMRYTSEVNWTALDFAFAAVMFLVVGGLLELAVRAGTNRAYRIACGLAILTSFLLIWINAAVGIVGDEDNPFNLLFMAAIVAMIGGTVASRGDAQAMARSARMAFVFQSVVGLLALRLDPNSIPVTILFCGLWAAAAFLFSRSAAASRATGDS